MVWSKIFDMVRIRNLLQINIPLIMWLVGGIFLGYLAFVDTNQVDYSECTKYDVVIQDLRYNSTQVVAWTIIESDSEIFYYRFPEIHTSKSEYESLKKIVQSGDSVTISVSTQLDIRRILGIRVISLFGTKNAVDIRTENEVIFSINDYNKIQQEDKIVFVIVFLIFCFISIAWFSVYVFLNNQSITKWYKCLQKKNNKR